MKTIVTILFALSFTIIKGQSYRVTAVNKNGATSVSNEAKAPEARLFFPNAFSPNGDGWNDVFEFKGVAIKSLEAQVYNRDGIQVFAFTSATQTWDGKGCIPGVYTIKVSYVTYAGDYVEKIGKVLLIQ